MEIFNISSPAENSKCRTVPSFESFYEENYSKVLFYLYKKMNNRCDAEDLAGEVFLYCYDHYKEYDPLKSSVSTWLYLIVNSRLKNHYRDKKEYSDISEMENYLYTETDEVEKAVYLEQLRKKISESLMNLPERQRKIVIMRYFKEMDYPEIAERLELSAGNVRVILSRALDKMELDFKEFTIN